MEPVIELDGARVFHGDCRDVLAVLPDNSVDSIVTDPPYELGFMGKSWDASGIAYNSEVWEQCLRVLKPGGHLLAFGGTRTWHRLAVAVEDAGFEVRDSIAWMYGSGFPKSLDVSKAIEKKLGVEPIGKKPAYGAIASRELIDERGWNNIENALMMPETQTEEGKRWQGWGTALKPAFEPIVVARKPLSGTVAETVLKWGTGGLNIDGSRIGAGTGESRTVSYPDIRGDNYQQGKEAYSERGTVERVVKDQGRWPANVILDEVSAGLLDEQSGESPSRFFYQAKASKRDRNEGLEELEDGDTPYRSHRPNFENTKGIETPFAGAGRSGKNLKNFHPTVKPTALMRYLVKLVTPPGGTVLDPFTGSGSTGKAAILEGFDFVGVELTDDYLPIIEGRLKWALDNQDEGTLF